MTRCPSTALLALFLTALPLQALAQSRAQGLQLQQLEGAGLGSTKPDGWSVTVGLGLADAPVYPGASQERVHAIPLFAVSYSDLLVISPFGLAVKALRLDGFFAGPVLGYEGSRRESDDPRLAGLGDIPASITGGVFAGYRLGRWEALLTARQALTHSSNGLQGLLELNYRMPLAPARMSLTLGPQLTFADAQFNRTWFGVSAVQSGTSGLPVYTPDGGVDSYGLHASLTSAMNEHLLIHAFAEVHRFTGDVADSPIVQRPTQGSLGVGVAYHF